jgi:signal transduction histidine kinase
MQRTPEPSHTPMRSAKLGIWMSSEMQHSEKMCEEKYVDSVVSAANNIRMTQLHRMLQLANETITLADESDAMFERLNEIIADSALFSILCIAINELSTGKLTPVACSHRFGHEIGAAKIFMHEVFINHCAQGIASPPSGIVYNLGHESNDGYVDGYVFSWRTHAQTFGLGAYASLPIAFGEQPFGSIFVFAATTDQLSSDIVQMLRHLASNIGAALSTLQKVAEQQKSEQRLAASQRALRSILGQVHDVRDEERSRIARELHDGVGQTLHMLKLDIAALGNQTSRASPGYIERIDRMALAVSSSLAEVNVLVSALFPRIVDDLGFWPSVDWLVADFTARTGIICRLVVDEPIGSVSRSTASAAFKCLQDCLNSVGTQTHATLVEVKINDDDSSIKISIAHNGMATGEKPIWPDLEPLGSGYINPRQRVELMGGTLSYLNKGTKRTFIEFEFPLTPFDESGITRTTTA